MKRRLTTETIRLETLHQEARVDSRIIATHLGNRHKYTLELIRTYQVQLQTLGVLPFQTAKPRKNRKGGRPETYTLLNEDQCYFLLTLCSNTEQAVALKLKLVHAFRNMRESLTAIVDYLPCYRDCHDAISQLVRLSGSTTPEHIHHMNIERVINKELGIAPGERSQLPPPMLSIISVAEQLAGHHYKQALATGHDHKHAYTSAKRAVASYANTIREALPSRGVAP